MTELFKLLYSNLGFVSSAFTVYPESRTITICSNSSSDIQIFVRMNGPGCEVETIFNNGVSNHKTINYYTNPDEMVIDIYNSLVEGQDE